MEKTVKQKLNQARQLVDEAAQEHLNSLMPCDLVPNKVEKMLTEVAPFRTAVAAIKRIVQTK